MDTRKVLVESTDIIVTCSTYVAYVVLCGKLRNNYLSINSKVLDASIDVAEVFTGMYIADHAGEIAGQAVGKIYDKIETKKEHKARVKELKKRAGIA